MDVRLSSEQRALRDSAAQVLANLGPNAVGALDDAERAAKLDAAVAAAGWRELRSAADDGGAPWASGVEVAIVAEQLGRGVADTAFLGPTLAAELRRLAGAPPATEPETVLLTADLASIAVLADDPSRSDAAIAVDAGGATSALALVPLDTGPPPANRVQEPEPGAGTRGSHGFAHAERDGAHASGWALVAVPIGTPEVTVDLTRPVARPAGEATPVEGQVTPLDAAASDRVTALALATAAADLVGAMQGAVDLASAYAAERKQYGQPVGAFQAVQHLLADALVLTEGSRSAALHAAWAVDALAPADAVAAAAEAKAYAARAARDVGEIAIQVHGGIGNTWECMAHVHLRRSLLSAELLGGVDACLARVLDHHLAGGPTSQPTSTTGDGVDFSDSPEEAAFRARLREWLVDNNPKLPASSTDDAYWEAQPAWHHALYDAGFFGMSWPKDIGGHGMSTVYETIVDDELAAAGAPPRPSLGYLVVGFLEHGGERIRERFLPGIVNGRDRWCQGFSEPDAGSDLASLRTRADKDGDEYVITGHKVWTSYSDMAEWCVVLARTDHDVPKHKGISAFAVRMDAPGVEQRPLKMINGVTREFGEVLFDGVRVPASDMIGEPGVGWRLAMTVVSHEREPGELGFVSRYRKTVHGLVEAVAEAPDAHGPEARRELAWAIVESEMLRHHVSRRLSDRLDGIHHGPEGSIDKLLMTWTEQTVGHAALAVAGAGHAGGDQTALKTYLYSRAQSVMGGTSQIQRNLIATRILGLPTS